MRDELVPKLLEIRDRERLTTAAMARRLGVDPSYLHLVFRGERSVGRKMLDGAIREFPEVQDAYARSLTISNARDAGSHRSGDPSEAVTP